MHLSDVTVAESNASNVRMLKWKLMSIVSSINYCKFSAKGGLANSGVVHNIFDFRICWALFSATNYRNGKCH